MEQSSKEWVVLTAVNINENMDEYDRKNMESNTFITSKWVEDKIESENISCYEKEPLSARYSLLGGYHVHSKVSMCILLTATFS